MPKGASVRDRRSFGTTPDNAQSAVSASVNESPCPSAGQLVGAFRSAWFLPLDWPFLPAAGLRSLAQPTGGGSDEPVEFAGASRATRHVSTAVRGRPRLAGQGMPVGGIAGKSSVERRRAMVHG